MSLFDNERETLHAPSESSPDAAQSLLKLKESEQRLQMALSAGRGIGLWDWDIPNDRVVSDERFALLYGVDPDEARRGAPIAFFFQGIDPDDLPRVRAAVSKALSTGDLFSEEYRLRLPDDRVRWVVAEGRCEMAPDGSPLRFPGISFDISDRKATEFRLRELNADLERRVLERTMAVGRTWQISPDLLCVLDTQGRIMAANPAFEKMLGWTIDEVTSTSFPSFVHPDDLAATYAAWTDMVERGMPALRFENRWRTKEGGLKWISWVGVPEEGQMYCIGRDVTEQKEHAQVLARRTAERDVLATIVETTEAFVLVLDPHYRILAINRANAEEFERAFGRRPSVGDSLVDLLAHLPEQRDQAIGLWRRALAGEAFSVVADFGDSKTGDRTYDIKFEVLRDAAGIQTGAFSTSTEVTDRLSEQRALADAMEALRQAQKMEAVGQLTGGVAHDFNNLLTVISTSVALLRRPTTSEEQRTRSMDAIAKTVKRASRLTGQLLAFARRQALTPTVFDASQNVAAVTEMIGTLIGARMQLETSLGDECFIDADPGQFDTAVVNLTVNARDAMNGSGQLHLDVRRVDGVPSIRLHPAIEGDYVAVSVTDTGNGISPENLERIFEPFFTTKGPGHGTGLGLSQVFGFAKQSGGEVEVESTVGQGTRFTLYFPRVQQAAANSADLATASAAQGRREGTVLVVEDNAEVAAAVTQSLNELGYATVHVVDARLALEALEREAHSFALVFSDVIMTGMDGVELGRAIRRRWPQLPVVLTSGYSNVLSQESDHGFEVLAKPYDLEALGRTMLRATTADKSSEPASQIANASPTIQSMMDEATAETRRQAELDSMQILDTAPEAAFDDLVRMASEICGTPVALLSLVDRDRQWFKARVGLEATESPREYAFCAHAIQQPERTMVVEDASQDPRFATNPLVTGGPGIRFYAGAPLVTTSGQALGTLCVIAPQARALTPRQGEILQFLADEAVRRLEVRRARLSH